MKFLPLIPNVRLFARICVLLSILWNKPILDRWPINYFTCGAHLELPLQILQSIGMSLVLLGELGSLRLHLGEGGPAHPSIHNLLSHQVVSHE